jgi:hypothetical protein
MHSNYAPVRPSARVKWFAEKKEAKNKKQTKSKRDRDRQVKEGWGGGCGEGASGCQKVAAAIRFIIKNNYLKSLHNCCFKVSSAPLCHVGVSIQAPGTANDEWLLLSTPPPLERFLAYYPRLIRSCNVRSCNCNVDYRKGRLHD